ncbi:MAG: tetratricopeptide repeat protein, partial [Polyangia bacterium]|nr:tetratricopeptide repeat protein [Polyangia bacterium]
MKDQIQGYLARLEEEPERREILEKLTKLVSDYSGADRPGLARGLAAAAERITAAGHAETSLLLLDLEEQVITEDDARAELLYRRGRLLEEELLDESGAIACYQRILALRPEDGGAEERMSHIGLVRENWEKIVQKYLDEAQASTDKALTTSLYRSVAEIYQKNVPGAAEVETYLRRSLDVDPTNSKSAAHLERILRRAKRWDDLVAFLQGRIERLEDGAVRDSVRMTLGRVLGAEVGDRDGMKAQFQKVLDRSPAHPLALSALADAYQEDEAWEDLILIYEASLAARGGEPDLGLHIQIGMLWWKKVGDLEQAAPYFKRVRQAQPANTITLDFLREYHAQRGEWEELLRQLLQAQRLAREPEEKLQLAVEMADIAETKAGNPEKAIDLWKGVARQRPGDPEAKAALRRLFKAAEKWNALLEILKEEEASLTAEDVAGKVSVLHEMVEIYRDRLNLDVMVINTYNAILAVDGGNSEALDALAEKYEAMNRWNDLIGVLHRKADGTQDKASRRELLRRVAHLWMDKFSNPNKAIEPLEQMLEVDPTDPEALSLLKDIYERRRNWRGLLGLVEREIEELAPADRRPKLLEMAELCQKRLGDPKAAIGAWNRLLELDDHDPEAIDALIALYDREKRYPALAEMLERRLAMATDEEAVPLLERLGALWSDRIEAPRRGIIVWKRLLQLRPGHSKALRVLRDLYAAAADWTALETLAEEQNTWPDFIEVLLQAADRAEAPDDKVALYFKVAGIWTDKLGKPDRAVKAFERILAVEPGNLQAAQALVPIYEGAQKWPRLLATYEVLLGYAEGKAEQLDLHRKIWELCEQKLGSKILAFDWCARAFAISPEDESLVAELERLAKEADAYEKLTEIYTRRVEALQDEAEKTALHRKLARITLELQNDPAAARGFYEAILAAEPDDEDALGALQKISEALEDWPRLLQVYDRQVELAADLDRKLEILFRAGMIQEEILKDLDSAVGVYDRILALEPSNQRSLRALEKLHTEREDWRALVGVLVRQLTLARDSAERVALEYRLGTLHAEHLSDRRAALDCYKRALGEDGLHRATVAALEGYLGSEDPLRAEVAAVMAPFYETTEDWPRLAQALEILLGVEQDEVERRELMKRLSPLYGRRLGDAEGAFTNAKRIFSLAPEDEENRRELRALADMLQDFDALIALYAEGFEERSPELQRTLAWEIASTHHVNLADSAKARPWYEKVLALEEGHDGAFGALNQILREAGQWTELRELLGRRVQIVMDQEARKELLFQICALNEDVLADVTAAIESYRSVLEIEPGNQQAFAALERLYELADQWPELETLLSQELGFVEDEARIADLQFRRGQLLARRLGNADGAVDLFTEVLAHDEGHRGALGALEEMLSTAELRQRVASILEPRYESAGDWAKLVAVLEVQLEAAPDEHAKVELLARIAEIQGASLMDPDASFATWRRALSVQPGNQRVREALSMLIETSGRWEDAAAVWQEGLAAADPSDTALADELMLKLAQLYERQLMDASQATHWYRTLLDKDPSNLEMAKPSAEALGRLYEAAGDWSSLIGILRREVEWAEDGVLRKSLLYRIAEIQETALENPASAIETFQELVDFDPEEEHALDSLERLFFQGEKWNDLIGILKRRVELSPDAGERRALLGRVAMLYEEALENAEEASSAWMTVLDEQPSDLEAIRALARLYEQASRWNDLLGMLERELDLLDDDAARVALTYRLGDLLQHRLDDSERAIYRYNQVLEIDRGHAEARRALEEMLGDSLLAMPAAEILEPIYTTESNWEKLCSIYDLKAENTADPAEKVRQYVRIAEIQETGMGNTGAAFDYYGRAIKEAVAEPGLREILQAYERLTSQNGRWADLVALYRAVAGEILDASLQEQVRVTVAEVSRLHLGDMDTSRAFFKQVLDADPENVRALDALEGIYVQTQDWEPLLQVYEARADLAGDDPPLRRSYLARAAHLCEEYLDRSEEAIRCWEQCISLDPKDREATSALERLYAKGTRWADLADLIEGRFPYVEELAEAVALRYQLGTILRHQLDEPDRALENYRAALGGDPFHAEAIDSIERFLDDPDRRGEAAELLEPIYAARQNWPRLIEIYKIRREAVQDLELRPKITRKIAMLYEEQLEDLDQAFTWYGNLFKEAPEEKQVRDQLTRLANIQEKWAALAEILADHLKDVYDESPASLEVGEQLARIYDERLDDVDKAKESYLRVLQSDRSRPRVFESLERILTRAERWNDLLAVYREAADGALEPDERKGLLFKICTIWEEALGNLDESIDAYRAVLELGDNDRRAISSLDRLFVQQKRWTDLVELLHRQLEQLHAPGEIIPIKLRLGALYEERLEDPASAIDAYEEVLGMDGGNPDAIAALERLINSEDHRFRIAQILEPVYKALDEWRKLIVIYEAQLLTIDDQARRVEILRDVAMLQEHRAGDASQAFDAMAKAWREDITDQTVLQALEVLASKIQDWGRLVEVLAQGVADSYDYELQASIWLKIARIREEAEGNPEAAVVAYNKLLEVREDSEEAIGALERLLPSLSRWEDLIKILRKKAELSAEPFDQKDCYYKIAEIQEHTLGQSAEAIATLRQVLAIDESDEVAIASLERLYLGAESWKDLVEIYRRKIDSISGATERRTIVFQMAYVLEAKLEEPYDAVSAYRSILDQDPGDKDALMALNRLYTNGKQWPDLLEVLDKQIEISSDEVERCNLQYRAGWVLQNEMEEVELAIERYERVLGDNPTYADARLALEELVRTEDGREAASRVLEPLYRHAGDWQPLIAVLELRVGAESDRAAKAELLRQVAMLNEEGRSDARAAFHAYSRALAEEPGDDATAGNLERLALALGAWADLADLYEKVLADVYDDELGRRLTLTLARLYEEALGDPGKAIAKYRKAYEYGGDEEFALAALDRLLERTQDWEGLADVLKKQVDAISDPDAQAAFLFRLGALRRQQFRDNDGALQAYRDVLERSPGHAGALEALESMLSEVESKGQVLDILEPVYESAGNNERLAWLATQRLELLEDRFDRAALLERIAELAEQQRQDPARALDAWGRALAERPDEQRYLDEMQRLAESLGRF